ncbi:odorant receptor 2a-like isoform X2 [Microplitis mediator]|uniref:odorant receptor 2a-like isoform X2 n=1 Tax=Microplitis mediator TaxID=375433 RepID=UPI0025548C64|nr:odorant receptor 2a-like isoform X2 [Microplitis mediator]
MDFEKFVDNIFNAITHIKFWKKNVSLTFTKNVINIFLNIVLLTLSSLLVISETIDIHNSYDLTSFAGHLNPVLFHSIGLFKWIFIIMKMNDIEDILLKMKRCHSICLAYHENEKERYQYDLRIINFQQKMIKFTQIWFFICLSGVIQWCMNPVVYDYYNIYILGIVNRNYTRNLPYPGVYPWIIDSNYKYIMTFAFQLTSAISTSIEMATSDILNVIFLYNISFNIQLLNDTLIKEKDVLLSLRFSNSDLAIKKFRKKLRNCLIHHQEILEFVDKLKNVSSYPIFLLCLDSTVALCLISLEVSTIEINSSIECIMKLMSMAEYWSGVTVELFLFSFLATKIEELGLKTADAIYSCNWEQSMVNHKGKFSGQHRQITVEINQMINFSLMRAQKPILFNGGLFYILSLQTFKALTGFALSNAVVLRQLSGET